jgi:hypothetical protein
MAGRRGSNLFRHPHAEIAGSLQVSGSVGQWVSGSVGQWVSGSVGQWVSGSVGQWISGSVDQWISGSVDQWISACRAHFIRRQEDRHSRICPTIQRGWRVPP